MEIHRRPSGQIIADGIEWLGLEDPDAIDEEAKRLLVIAAFIRRERRSVPDLVRAAAARARVAADAKRGVVTPDWIMKLAEG